MEGHLNSNSWIREKISRICGQLLNSSHVLSAWALFIFFLILWPHPWHMEDPGPGIEYEPQLSCGNADFFTHCTPQGLKPLLLQQPEPPQSEFSSTATSQEQRSLWLLLFLIVFLGGGSWGFSRACVPEVWVQGMANNCYIFLKSSSGAKPAIHLFQIPPLVNPRKIRT